MKWSIRFSHSKGAFSSYREQDVHEATYSLAAGWPLTVAGDLLDVLQLLLGLLDVLLSVTGFLDVALDGAADLVQLCRLVLAPRGDSLGGRRLHQRALLGDLRSNAPRSRELRPVRATTLRVS
ncbi:hypothetical protein MRX96_023515 [Rhipicephalus microplus]